MTANEFIYAVREKLKAYVDDTKYGDDYIMYLGNLKRALYIRREYNQLQRIIDTDILQTICMELEEVDSSECPDCEENYECQVIRTVQKVPSTIELHSRSTITRVAPVGISEKAFSFIRPNKFIYAGEGKYEKNITFATLNPNGHIYLKSNNNNYKSLEYITVTGLFDNPEDVQSFDCSTGNCYDPSTDEWPIEAWMADVIIMDIVNELANLKQLREDNRNNAKEDN